MKVSLAIPSLARSFPWLFKSRRSSSQPTAFTLLELLVVVCLIAFLGLVLLPAHAATRVKSQSIRCVDNLRELMGAVMMYTHDNHDFYPPDPDDGNVRPGHSWSPGEAGPGGAQEFNSDILADPTRCLIATYINTNASLFRCTADLRVGTYQGTDPTKIGTIVPAARTVSMNAAVGTICASFDQTGAGHSGRPTLSVNGPWLDNQHSHRRNAQWRTFGKVSETMVPGPDNLWVIAEEDPYSINDAGLAVGMKIAEWIDWPGTLHAMSGVLTFGDGHVEIHKWTDQRTRVINGNVSRRAVPA